MNNTKKNIVTDCNQLPCSLNAHSSNGKHLIFFFAAQIVLSARTGIGLVSGLTLFHQSTIEIE